MPFPWDVTFPGGNARGRRQCHGCPTSGTSSSDFIVGHQAQIFTFGHQTILLLDPKGISVLLARFGPYFPRPCTPVFITRTCRGGGEYDRPRLSKLSVVELSRKNQRIALDEYSRLVVRFSSPIFDPVKGQIIAKATTFQLNMNISQKL